MNKFKNFLKDKDQFGYETQLTDEGDAHKTNCGGFITLITKFMFLIALAINIIKMFS